MAKMAAYYLDKDRDLIQEHFREEELKQMSKEKIQQFAQWKRNYECKETV